jgi:hypothetical protein
MISLKLCLIFFLLAFVKNQSKKGIGLSSDYGLKQLLSLNVSWFYNWGVTPSFNTTAPFFVPMIYSKNTINKILPTNYSYVLGFNEPDNDQQANMTAAAAYQLWPNILTLAQNVKPTALIGAPAMAGTSIDAGTWLPTFMSNNPKVDFITIHWYKGTSSDKFISDIKSIINYYKLPVWITEFAPQTSSSSKDSPLKYTQSDVNNFIMNVINWMESEPMVQRYAWHNSKVSGSSCNLFNDDGSLTQTGVTYAMANGASKLNSTSTYTSTQTITPNSTADSPNSFPTSASASSSNLPSSSSFYLKVRLILASIIYLILF